MSSIFQEEGSQILSLSSKRKRNEFAGQRRQQFFFPLFILPSGEFHVCVRAL